MKSIDQWFLEYGESHQNSVNIIIHKLCVPLIMLSLLGILWSLPNLGLSYQGLEFNWSYVLIIISMVFYLALSKRAALLMAIQTFLMLSVVVFFQKMGFDTLRLSIIVFIVAWIGQFIGHKIEGKKPSFLQDLQFLLIGPLWVVKDLIKF